MSGLSCQGCIFAQYTASSDDKIRSQNDCLLDRIYCYENVDIINEECGGTYKVLTKNICPAKRKEKWLKSLPFGVNPVRAVRQELYPKIQLFIIIGKDNNNPSAWIDIIQKCVDYSAIDVLYFGRTQDMLNEYSVLLNQKQVYLHSIHKEDSVKNYINKFARSDCDYYAIFEYEHENIINIPDKLDYWLNDKCKTICMVYGFSSLHNVIVNVRMHEVLCGFGEQCIVDKIKIHCANHDSDHLVITMEELNNEYKSAQSFNNNCCI